MFCCVFKCVFLKYQTLIGLSDANIANDLSLLLNWQRPLDVGGLYSYDTNSLVHDLNKSLQRGLSRCHPYIRYVGLWWHTDLKPTKTY